MPLPPGIGLNATACANHHIGPFRQQCTDQFLGIGWRIGAITISHHINISLDIGKHPPHDMPFTLTALSQNFCTSQHSLQGRAVGRVVVINDNTCAW
ncbi:hypothetical protein D3C80_1873090 [compost metagenome]